MKIFLIRHGETTGDIEDRYGGWYDDSLTEKGEKQLEQTAKKLAGKNIEVIFSSPLIRAKQSAEIIKNEINSEIEIIHELKERNYGILGGMIKAEAKEKYPDEVAQYFDPKNSDNGRESFEGFRQRVLVGLEKVKISNKNSVAIVSHGGPIKIILEYFDKDVPEKIGDGAIFELDV